MLIDAIAVGLVLAAVRPWPVEGENGWYRSHVQVDYRPVADEQQFEPDVLSCEDTWWFARS